MAAGEGDRQFSGWVLISARVGVMGMVEYWVGQVIEAVVQGEEMVSSNAEQLAYIIRLSSWGY